MPLARWRAFNTRITAYWDSRGRAVVLSVKVLHGLTLVAGHIRLRKCRLMTNTTLVSSVHCLVQVDSHVLVNGFLCFGEDLGIYVVHLSVWARGLGLDG